MLINPKQCKERKMWVEIGHMAMILAICSMLWLLILAYGYRIQVVGEKAYLQSHKSVIIGFFILSSLSYLTLTWAFIQDDYSVQYVWAHSHDDLPWYYKITATWGGHEGSWLLWIWLLSGYLAYSLRTQNNEVDRIRLESPVIAAIVLGLGGFMLLTSNPFDSCFPFSPQEMTKKEIMSIGNNFFMSFCFKTERI